MKKYISLFILFIAFVTGCTKTNLTDTYLATTSDGSIMLEFYKNGDVLATHTGSGRQDWCSYSLENDVEYGTKVKKLYLKYLILHGVRYIYTSSDDPAIVLRSGKIDSFTIRINYYDSWDYDGLFTFRKIK